MTRRTVALSVAIAMVWVTPVLGGAEKPTPPDASMRSVAITEWHAVDGAAVASRTTAATTEAWAVTDPMDAGDAVLVGADWGGDAGTEVQVRARDADGWGDWMELHLHSDHAPDPGAREAAGASTSSEPVWVGRVDQLQVRGQGDLDGLQLDVVEIAGDLAYDPGGPPPGAAVAATEIPWIRPRSYWGADESLRTKKIEYADDVRFSVVHHEGGAPRWSWSDIEGGCQEAAAAINAIYEYHTRGRGYWDIAYNFVVDPCGRIWEGRAGGMDRPVQGAHAAGWNSGSVGVLALGTFSDGNSDPVTDDMVEGIERLLTWKLDHHHTDPRGTTREVAGGGSSNRYAEGTEVDVPILSAHQITNLTTCPGGVLMDRLFDGRNASATPTWSYTDNVFSAGMPKAFDEQPADWAASEKGDRPDWDVDFSEPLDWSLRITDEDGGLVRATGGTAEEHVERTWDLRDAAGDLVDAGTYTATITGTGESGEITPVETELVVSPTVARRMGETRIGTSVALSEWAFESADTAIVASAAAYPDALVSGPLAGTLEAPVLLTDHGDLPEQVEDEIRRLGASTVHVIGGEVAVGEAVVDELEGDLDVAVDRIGGEDRFATAALVAQRVREAAPSTEVLVSLGAHDDPNRAFPDALSAGAFGAELKLPVLLTRTNALPTATREALAGMAPESVRVFGGTVAISDAVERQVARASGAPVERFAGETRYDTSRLAAEALLARRDVAGPAEADESTEPVDLIFASGGNWPDALGAGAAAARTGTTFLLAHPEDLDAGAATRTFLEDWEARIGAASVAGGPVAMAGRVVTAIAAYVTTGDGIESEPITWPEDPHATSASTVGATASPSPTESGSPSPSPSPTDASPSPSPTEGGTGSGST